MALVTKRQTVGGLPRLDKNRPSSCGAVRRSSAEVVVAPAGLRRTSSSPTNFTPPNWSNVTVNVRGTPGINGVLGQSMSPNILINKHLIQSASEQKPACISIDKKPASTFVKPFVPSNDKKPAFMGTPSSSLENLETVIFLDVDGVLHPCHVHHQRQQFDKRCMILLAEIVNKTDATIVLSTAWRVDAEARRMISDKLAEYDLPQFVSKTPQIAMFKRTREILSWVKRYKPVTWIAIDDLPLQDENPEEMIGHFVHTRARFGLQHDNVQQAIELFRTQKQRLRQDGMTQPLVAQP